MRRDAMRDQLGHKANALIKKAQKKFTSKWRQKRSGETRLSSVA